MKNKLETISNLFEGKEIRSIWNSEKEEYYFSVVDVISALTDSKIPKRYWTDLKRKLENEGSKLYENIVQLKMQSLKDGKYYNTDVLDTKGILRLIESVPSGKAEPFKLWLANLGSERIDENLKIGRRICQIVRRGLNMVEIKLNDFKIAMDKIVTKIQQTQLEIFENANANVEYALRDINKPIGVSSYELSEYLPPEIKEFPTEEELNLHIDFEKSNVNHWKQHF